MAKKRGKRFSLLMYGRMWQRWAFPCLFVAPASVVLWFLSPRAYFVPDSLEPRANKDEVPVVYRKPFKTPLEARHPYAKYRLNEVDAQDFMAWETQGPIHDRTRERLAGSDRGIVLLREMLEREIKKVEQHIDPINVFRDPAHPIIDTRLEASLHAGKAGSVPYHVPKAS